MVNTLINSLINILSNGYTGKKIYNIADVKPYSQKDVAKWFYGKELIIPILLTEPIYWMTYLLPKNYGYKIRCLYWKIFRSNVYNVTRLVRK